MVRELPLLEETLEFASLGLVEDAPAVRHEIGASHVLHAVRLRMRSRGLTFYVYPNAVELVLGFRVVVVPDDADVEVTSVVANMREHVSKPFDLTRWSVPSGYVVAELGLISWLFPLEMSLRRVGPEALVDVFVVSENVSDAGKIP